MTWTRHTTNPLAPGAQVLMCEDPWIHAIRPSAIAAKVHPFHFRGYRLMYDTRQGKIARSAGCLVRHPACSVISAGPSSVCFGKTYFSQTRGSRTDATVASATRPNMRGCTASLMRPNLEPRTGPKTHELSTPKSFNWVPLTTSFRRVDLAFVAL